MRTSLPHIRRSEPSRSFATVPDHDLQVREPVGLHPDENHAAEIDGAPVGIVLEGEFHFFTAQLMVLSLRALLNFFAVSRIERWQ
jgi:hypothetical protein